MPSKLSRVVLLVLIPMIVFPAPKKQAAESIQLEVVSTRTNYHGSSPDVFKYTKVIFARVSGKNVVCVCEQEGDECPLMQDGKTYSAYRVGGFTYFSMSIPEGGKPMPIKYKETGSW